MKFLLSLFLLASACVTDASATTLGFNELVPGTHLGSTYAAEGYTLTGTRRSLPNGDFFVSNAAGSPALTFRDVGAPIELRATDGGLFDVLSIDIAWDDARGQGFIGLPVTFTGLKAGGAKVRETFLFPDLIDGKFTPFVFSAEFSGLTGLAWAQGAVYHQFDNIVLRPSVTVPAPATLWLCLTALLALGGLRARRRPAPARRET